MSGRPIESIGRTITSMVDPLRTAVGTMQGCYQMVTAEGEHFDAEIAPFTLAVPHALN